MLVVMHVFSSKVNILPLLIRHRHLCCSLVTDSQLSPSSQPPTSDCVGSVAFWEFWFSRTAGLSWFETENQTDNPVMQPAGVRISPSLHGTQIASPDAEGCLTDDVICGSPLCSIIQRPWMERHPDCTGCLFQDEERRMAGVQARKEEEKKRESHKQTIHKVPLRSSDSLLLSMSLSLHSHSKHAVHTQCWPLFWQGD